MALVGNLEGLPLPDLVSFYCSAGQTASLTLTYPDAEARLFFEAGELVDADLGTLRGVEAVYAAMARRGGSFRVELHVPPPARTILEPWNAVLLEGARRLDESRRAPQEAAPREPRICPICFKSFPEGSSCPDDGAMLVLRARPASGEMPATSPEPAPPAPAAPEPGLPAPAPLEPALPALASLEPALPPPPRNVPRPQPFQRPKPAALRPVPRRDGRRNATLAAAGIAALVLGIVYFAFVRAPGPAGSPPVAKGPAAPLTFGLATALSGPSAESDRRMTMGFEAALGLVNRDGGVNGHKLRCIALDDGGEPARTPDVLDNLIGTRKVFALVGSAGTPTAPVAVPWAAARNVLFFAAFTGAGLVRQEPPDRTVFTLGASWSDEAAALIRYFVEARKIRPSEIVVLAPREGLGETAFSGVAKALMKYGRAPEEILRVEDPESSEAVDALRKGGRPVRAIVIAAPSAPAVTFIAKLRDSRIDAIVGVLSLARSDVLAEELRRFGPAYSTGIVGTQPVPLVDAPLPGVAVYREALERQFPGEKPDAVSMEGFLAGRVFAEALRRAGQRPTTESVVNALEGLRDFDLGIGAAVNFGPSEHQGLHRVWGAVLDANGGWRALDIP